MLDHLPAPGDPFPKEARTLWLQILELSFKLIFPEDVETGEPEPEPEPEE